MLVIRSSLRFISLSENGLLGRHIIGEGRGLELLPPGHLGPLLHWTVSTKAEVQARVDSAWKSWYAYKAIWSLRDHDKFMKQVFMAVVAAVLISGLVVMPLADVDVCWLAICYYAMLRKLAKGKGKASVASIEQLKPNPLMWIYQVFQMV